MNKWFMMLLILVLFWTGCTTVDELAWKKEVTYSIMEGGTAIEAVDVIPLQSGKLMAVCEAPFSAAGGGLLKMVSERSPRIWSKPDTIVHSTLQCGFPAVSMLRDGLILITFGMYRNNTENQRGFSAGLYLIQSFDNGRSFTVPRRITVEGFAWVRPTDNIIERKDGSLLLPLDAGSRYDQVQPVILVSSDRGETWDRMVTFVDSDQKNSGFRHAKLVFFPDKRLLCVLERKEGDGYLYTTHSKDGGLSWIAPERTNIMGYNHDVILDPGNRLICVFRDNWPEGISTMISYDYGKSWIDEVQRIETKNFGPVLFNYKDDFTGLASLSSDSTCIEGLVFYSCNDMTIRGFSGSYRDGRIHLRWNEVEQASYYVIFRSSEAESDVIAMKIPDGNIIATSTQPYFVDLDVEKGQTYWYRVAAVAGHGRPMPETGNLGEVTDDLKVVCE